MARVTFTQNIQRHVPCPPAEVPGRTVREVLDAVFDANPRARGYVLDDQGALRKHMVIFVDGDAIHDRTHLGDAVTTRSDVYVMQALSGGSGGFSPTESAGGTDGTNSIDGTGGTATQGSADVTSGASGTAGTAMDTRAAGAPRAGLSGGPAPAAPAAERTIP